MATRTLSIRKGDNADSPFIECDAFVATAGRSIIVGCTHEGLTTTITVTDTAGNTYTPLTKVGHSDGDNWAQIFYAENITGHAANVIRMTVSSSRAYKAFSGGEYSGLATSSSFVAESNGEATGATNVATGNMVATGSGVIFAVAKSYNDSSWTLGTSMSNLIEEASTFKLHASEDRVIASGGTYTADINRASSTHLLIAGAIFKDAPVPAIVGLRRAPGPGVSHDKAQQFRPRALAVIPPPNSELSATGTIVFSEIATLVGLANPAKRYIPGPGISPDYNQLFRARRLAISSAASEIAGTGSITFSQTSTLVGDGALTSTGTITFSQTATLVGSGALASTGTIVFGESATLIATGALAATGTIVFDQTAILTEQGSISGTGSIVCGESGTLDVPVSQVGVGAPGGGGSLYKRGVKLKDRPNKHLKKILEDVESVYRDIVRGPDVPAAVAEIVAPFTDSLRKLPPPAEIDWEALEADAARVRKLLSIWAAQERKRQIDAEEEWFLLSD